MSLLIVPLTGGRSALVCDDLDDYTVWAVAREHGCQYVLCLPDANEFLTENIDHHRVRELGFENLPRPPGHKG